MDSYLIPLTFSVGERVYEYNIFKWSHMKLYVGVVWASDGEVCYY